MLVQIGTIAGYRIIAGYRKQPQAIAGYRKQPQLSQAIASNRKLSQAIAAYRSQWQPMAPMAGNSLSQAIAGNRKLSQAIASNRSYRRQSQAIARNRRLSQAIAGNRKLSQAITSNRRQSQTITSNRKLSQAIAAYRSQWQAIGAYHKQSQANTSNRSQWQETAANRSGRPTGGRSSSTTWHDYSIPPLAMRPLLLIVLTILLSPSAYCQEDGKTLFQSNCAQCHNPIRVVTGPALKGITERVTDRQLLHDWIHNNNKVLASGNTYFNNLYNSYGRAPMNIFPNLSDADIDAIIKYVDTYAAPLAATNTSNYAPHPEQDDHTTLFGIVTFILAVFVGGLYLVNTNLKRLADEKRGLPAQPHIPFYRNKYYITAFSFVIFMLLGWWMIEWGVGLGRQKNYQPQQPIFFSHRVHVGLNQINCLLCHGNAWESKHATVPSPNICMNCHAAITEYHGEKLTRPDGSRVDPNEEIRKLYSYTGFNPDSNRYTRPGHPIQWVKIHNLPDLAYFNHAQHVRVGKVQCQTCHGPIQEMDEVRQFADLSMGWCINCHRTTKVDFPTGSGNASTGGVHGNNFYNIYSKFKKDLKNGDIDSVTVEAIGGTECQKCHY